MKKCLGCYSLLSDEASRCSACGFNSLQKVDLKDGKEIELEVAHIKDIDKSMSSGVFG